MEIGSEVRSEFDTDECVATINLFLNPIQAKWFESFERGVLRQGARWFLFPLWVGGELLDHTVRFRERPKMGSLADGHVTCAFTLDVGRREGLFPPDITEILIHVSPEEIAPLADILQRVVNVDWPVALPFPE
jgi:hypothetical protein